ncbi:MAG: protein translocase subunit SecD [Akkermansiaceae bacterium]|jgi:SecD/SecF fusion protein|nr:protein translocase subunit SecD [Akkermansiaceae bacterium]MDP4722585.1 protein translocase subunit SecD [Akkermansiaceae bacterium]MDP4780409.1 protein translocase subunit SecD [Akkermansiaceae bacterium]MDP4897265.1 protein translocase subunit SecD [Akkermansiaceae bacterium]
MPDLTFLQDRIFIFLAALTLLILFFWYFATEIERRKRNVGTILMVGIVALCALAIYPPDQKLKGGIDIVGGSAFYLRIQEKENENGEKMPVTAEQVEEAIRVIEGRLNALGTSEPLIARQGDDGILVQMPGVETEESTRIRQILETVAKLELREVSTRNDEIGADGRSLAARVLSNDEIVPGYRAYELTQTDEDGNEFTRPILLNRRAALGGSDIAAAFPSQQRPDAVSVTLNGDGTDKMIKLTSGMRKGIDRIAIVLDGVVLSAPTVNDNLGKQFEVSGLDDPGEPKELSNALMNPLENPLVVEQESSVSPTLGSAFVKQGIFSGLAGLAITAIFIFIYYRMAGVVALVALVINAVILFGVMAMFGFTFSLPGIAGLILTIGIAVDANVLIYERLREEIENGKSLKNAIGSAYDKAFSSILDANLTTLIACVILIAMASGSVKGFALTLTIGLLASMFSAILGTRVLFRWGLDTGMLRKLSFLNLIKSANFDFVGKAKACAVFSGILFAIAIGTFATKQKTALGIDFTGGTVITYEIGDESIPIKEVKASLDGAGLTREAFPQEQEIAGSGTLLTIRADNADADKIIETLRTDIPFLGEIDTEGNFLHEPSKEEVSATLGGSFLRDALIALGVGIIGIFTYIVIRFELSFALGAIVAVLHDIFIAIGIVVLLGEQLTQIHVAAILTIAGYSINDTIIVFDRIRETVLIRTGEVREVMNEAINQTLSRTILTSSTTIVTVLILAIFGGAALRDFSMTIIVGLVVGTYSSIFVASPIVLWWSSRKGGNLRKDVLATTLAAEALQQND